MIMSIKKIVKYGTESLRKPSKVISCYELGKCYRMENNIQSGTRYETCRSIHAEQNAIIQAGQDRCKGATMYIYGHDFICILCKRFIVQAGIKDVYLKKDALLFHAAVGDGNIVEWYGYTEQDHAFIEQTDEAMRRILATCTHIERQVLPRTKALPNYWD